MPKENKANKKTVIDIFESKGHLCPVKAFTRWADTVKPEPDGSRSSSGSNSDKFGSSTFGWGGS